MNVKAGGTYIYHCHLNSYVIDLSIRTSLFAMTFQDAG
jgi:hypothetical protein